MNNEWIQPASRRLFLPLRSLVLIAVLLSLVMFHVKIAPAYALAGETNMHDPSVIKVGSCYYAFSTGLYIGIKATKTCDSTGTTSWQSVGTIFSTIPAWIIARLGSNPGNLWAPDINYFNGKYYLYYGASIWGTNTATMGLATATNIEGPWTDQGEVTNVNYPIDPNVVWSSDNVPYMTWGSWTGNGINMHVLDGTTGKLSTTNNNLWNIATGIENSSIIYNNGYYYMFGSKGSCCSGVNSTYYTVVGRSATITGPYLDESGVNMVNGGGTRIMSGAGTEVAAGGADPFNDGGVTRLAYHYYDANRAGLESLNIRTVHFGDSPRTGAANWLYVSAPIYTPITGATVTASSSADIGGWLKPNVVDGQEQSTSSTMGWSSNNSLSSNHTEWVQLDFGLNKKITQIQLFPRTDGANTGYGFPIDFTIQLSADGTNWSTVLTKTATPLPTGIQTYDFNATTARYVKINATSLRANPNDLNHYRMQLAEIKTFGSNTGNLSELKPVTASSSYEGSDWFTHRVNDGQKGAVTGSRGWSSNNQLTQNHTESIKVDIGAVQSISTVNLYPRNDALQVGNGFPIDFTIQISSDNVNWSTVVTRTNYAKPGNAVQSFGFASQSVRYVKVTGTSLRPNPTESNYYRMQLAEIEIY